MSFLERLFQLLITCVIAGLVRTYPRRLPIGVIYSGSELRQIVHTAIDNYNSHVTSSSATAPAMFTLEARDILVDDVTDIVSLQKAVCRTLSRGVFALMNVATHVSTLVHSLSRNFDLPLVTISSPSPQTSHHSTKHISSSSSSTFSHFISNTSVSRHINPSSVSSTFFLLPSLTHALVDVMAAYGWNKTFFIYDTTEGLNRLGPVYSALLAERLVIEIESVRVANSTNCYHLLRRIDKRAATASKNFILDLSTAAQTQSVLRQAHSLGMTRHGYHYLLATHSMESLDLTSFRYGGAKITGFSLHNRAPADFYEQANNFHLLQSALAIDALSAVGHGLNATFSSDNDVLRSSFRRGQPHYDPVIGLHCQGQGSKKWVHGATVSKYFQQMRFDGQTGHVAFDARGRRTGYTLSILEQVVDSTVRKVGVWDSRFGLNLTQQARRIAKPTDAAEKPNKTRIVTSILSNPYLMLSKAAIDDPTMTGNDRFEGYCADLARELANLVKFDYELKIVADETYGTLLKDGTWNGMVGELVSKKADLAIAPLTITSARERFIDFSKPFMELGISIMIKKPEKLKPGVFSFMDPLSSQVWICIVLSYLGVSLVLFLVSRFSPYEWQIEDKMAGLSYSNDFTILNSLWFALGAFMRQGCDISPRSVSGRIVGSAWWFFTLIIISSYTANLAAFLTVERMLTPIESADDLVRQRDIQYGTLTGGSTEEFFRTSKVQTYSRMWEYMSNAQPSVMVSKTEDGVARVRSSKGKYAFLLESTMNEYHNQRKPCNTMKVGGNIDSKGYGIATPLDSDLRDTINWAVLNLMEHGLLQKYHKKWWYDKGECITDDGKSSGSAQSALTLSNVAGVFYILITGLCASLVFAILEFAYKTQRKLARHKKMFAELMRPRSGISQRNTESNRTATEYSVPSQMVAFGDNDDEFVVYSPPTAV